MKRYVQPKVDVTENGSIAETPNSSEKYLQSCHLPRNLRNSVALVELPSEKKIVFLQAIHYNTPYLIKRYDFYITIIFLAFDSKWLYFLSL